VIKESLPDHSNNIIIILAHLRLSHSPPRMTPKHTSPKKETHVVVSFSPGILALTVVGEDCIFQISQQPAT